MLEKIANWLDRRAVTQQRADYVKGFSWAAGQLILYGKLEHQYGKDDDFDSGVKEAERILQNARTNAENAEAALREADAYKAILEQLQDDLAAAIEAAAAVSVKRQVYPSLQEIINNNTLPDWPEVWVAQDEDGSVWAYKTEPTKTYLKADHTGGFEPVTQSSKRLIPPATLHPDWQQTKRRVK